MATPRSLRIVWSVHARIRELERVDGGIQIPPIGSFLRLLYLGTMEKDQRWAYLHERSFLYGYIFKAPDYDVFLISTVIARPHLLWKPPLQVSLYQLEHIYEQGTEGSESETWPGYFYDTDKYNEYCRPVSVCESDWWANA